MLARTDSRARALFLLIITAMLTTLIGGRLVFWQVIDRERLAIQAEPYAHKRWLVSSDADEHVEQVATYIGYGFDHLVFHFPTNEQEEAVTRYGKEILPRLRKRFG